MEEARKIFVVGRFPPPVDGQTMATERLADLLQDAFDVERINLSPPEGKFVQVKSGLRPKRVLHFLKSRGRVQSALSQAPRAPVLWLSISPSILGHARDLMAIRRAFPEPQPVFGVVHRGDFHKLWSRQITRYSGKRLLKRLQGLVFLSTSLAASCSEWVPPFKRFMIPNTVDEGVHCEQVEVEEAQRARINRDSVRLLFLSNMIPEKGYVDVLHAISQLDKQGLTAFGDFVGNWTSSKGRQAFEKTADSLEIAHLVEYHGPVYDREKVRQFYLNANAFLLPSYMPEAQPLTIIEALNAGTPVITTKQRGIAKMMRDGREGHFVPSRDPNAIAEAVSDICFSDQWITFSDKARGRFDRMFSPDIIRAQWLDLLAPYLA